jgi:type II secretory pathway component PulF
MRTHRLPIYAALAALLVTGACAARTAEKARTVSVNVHAVLAAVDDAEMNLYQGKSVPQWTQEKHAEFSQHMKTALQAGRALNESVRIVPITGQAKADLSTVVAELNILSGLVEQTLPPDSAVRLRLNTATQAVLRLLPLFLE